MLDMRGVIISYETVRELCLKLGQTYAKGYATSLHEVFLKINGRLHYLWRAVRLFSPVVEWTLKQCKRSMKPRAVSTAC